MAYCLPPDPNTRKPGFTPPANACDTHFHIFGPPETFPFLSTHEYTPPAAPLEHYLKMAEIIGMQRGVVVQPSVHGLDNAATLDAIAKSGGRFRGVARIDDKTSKSELQILHEGGVRGVRFNLLDRPRGNVKLDANRQAIQDQWPVQIVNGPNGPMVKLVGYVPNVDQTFGGLFKKTSPPPGRTQPPCVKKKLPWQGKIREVKNGAVTNTVIK